MFEANRFPIYRQRNENGFGASIAIVDCVRFIESTNDISNRAGSVGHGEEYDRLSGSRVSDNGLDYISTMTSGIHWHSCVSRATKRSPVGGGRRKSCGA